MISTHILDTGLGLAAAAVKVALQKRVNADWVEVAQGETNADGRLAFPEVKEAGDYRLIFGVEGYFKDRPSFFLDTTVSFRITDTGRKYHVPLLLNSYGYSSYRGT